MEKLRDIMKTKYITDDHAVNLGDVLRKVSAIDLEGCKFTPGAEKVLHNFFGTVDMCNSGNEQLDSILKHNCRAYKSDVKLSNIEMLKAEWNSPKELLDYLASLNKYTVYKMSNSSIRSISLAILILLKFPAITVDLGYQIQSVFDQVRVDWLQYREPHDEYWLVSGTGTILLKKNRYDLFEMPDGSEVREDQLVRMFQVLPSNFGSSVLYDSPEYEEVRRNAINNLLKTIEVEKSMKDYIEVV